MRRNLRWWRCCLMYFPLFVGVLCLPLFCFALLCVLSSFAIIFEEEERAGCFACIVLRMSCCCKRSVTFPNETVGWSAMLDDCGISWSYTPTFLYHILFVCPRYANNRASYLNRNNFKQKGIYYNECKAIQFRKWDTVCKCSRIYKWWNYAISYYKLAWLWSRSICL